MANFEERSGIVACKTDWGQWWQSLTDVFVEVNLPPGTKGREIQYSITPKKLSVSLKGITIFEGELLERVKPSESTWTLADNKLMQICLSKVDTTNCTAWLSLLKDQFQVDPVTYDEMEKKLTLEKMQNENPGFDFTNSSISGNYHCGGMAS